MNLNITSPIKIFVSTYLADPNKYVYGFPILYHRFEVSIPRPPLIVIRNDLVGIYYAAYYHKENRYLTCIAFNIQAAVVAAAEN